KGAKPRMEALNQVVKNDGVTHMIAICAICKSQFSKVFPEYGMGMDRVVSLHQLVSNAIVLDGQDTDNEDENEDGGSAEIKE
ncbi:MAG: (Fe-S)-binding protein, partial [Alphaproteobacteria bacterium]|nr:(Fe-S)-binding protein [Alphaproteobacteria bacterium]